jgi:hypothetical protein
LKLKYVKIETFWYRPSKGKDVETLFSKHSGASFEVNG